MFDRLGRLTYRRRRLVLVLAVLFVAVAAGWGTGVFGSLTSGGFEDPDSESARAATRIATDVGRRDADVVVLYSSPDGDARTVDGPGFRDAVTGTLDALPPGTVAGATSFWSTRSPALVSGDRRSTYVVLQLAGSDAEARAETYEAISDDLDAPGLTTRLGGNEPVNTAINERISADIARAEGISLPIVMILLVFLFGSLVAASMPLVVGVLAILGAFTALRLLTLVTDVSIFSVNIVTLLGLGLAIDYALFVVSRFREELGRGYGTEDALARTMATAGRTVAFSGVTVAVSLAGLLLFPQVFLRSMGYGGIAAVLVAMVASLTVLPALLAVLGPRVDALRVPLPWRRRSRTGASGLGSGRSGAGRTGAGGGAWARLAHSVMRRPVVYSIVVVGVLLALASPFLRVTFGGIDARALPAGTESRTVSEVVERDFPGGGTETVDVLVRGASAPAAQDLASRIGVLPGVSGVEVATSRGDSTLLAVRHEGDAVSEQARELVTDLRGLPAPAGSEVLVGGPSADLVDLLDSLASTLPWMALLVVGATFVLLFLAFGSLVLPIKAVLMNVLSMGASFGAVVWIFQDGNLAGPLGFTPTGTVEATQPILMAAIIFGLSMDYEVFLLSRVREQWDRTHDNTAAVAGGLQRTGAIITSAALLLVIVIGSFSTSGITFIKMIGVGMIVAIVVDATIVRALLVPATMRLLGRANWWAPGPLRRVYERFGVHEHDGDDDGPAANARGPTAAPLEPARVG